MKNLNEKGRLHPISIAIREIADIFFRMGFGIAYGPELEDEWHNFTSLNVPADHPSRDMQDTFWLRPQTDADLTQTNADEITADASPKKLLLRTHTTSVTMRKLEEMAKLGATEMRMINPGKVFRNEATDMTHEAQFYQLDGFAVGPTGTVTLANLKATLGRFYSEYLGEGAQVRFRPSYFPFTEPSVEVDAWFESLGKEGKWLEMCGGGMFHPMVLKNAGLDPEKIQGFAWGGGLERLIMVKYGIPDVRLFHSGDIRFNYAFPPTDGQVKNKRA